MCDQVTCLVSEEHAQSIGWSDESEDAGSNEVKIRPSRVHKFKVAKTNEQEESVIPRPGFKVSVKFLTRYLCVHYNYMIQIVTPVLADRTTKLISGERNQALLTTVYAPAGFRNVPLDQDTYNALQIRALLYAIHVLHTLLSLTH
jgi:hypothetical protein